MRIFIWLLAVPFALTHSGPPLEVQVMPPWNVVNPVSTMGSGGMPLDPGIMPGGAVPDAALLLLDPILKALENRGFIAYPALFTSAVQLARTFDSREVVDEMLAKEFPEQRQYLTLVPVVHGAQVIQRTMMARNRKEVVFRLELHVQDAKGGLGRLLATKEFSFTFLSQGATTWEQIETVFPEVERKVSSMKEWDSVALALRAEAPGFKTRFTGFGDSAEKRDGRRYFAQSEVFFNLPDRESRVTKANFQCRGKSARDLDDLNFGFLANEKWPVFKYAYILRPGRAPLKVGAGEAHVEQSPNALPSKIYDWSRVLVVNLPGLEQGSIVTYAVEFMRLPSEDERKDGRWRPRKAPTLAKDASILVDRGEEFQIRTLSIPGDSMGFSGRDVRLSNPFRFKLRDATMHLVSGVIDTSDAGLAPSRRDAHQPRVRLSNAGDWNALLAPVRDSVFTRLPPHPGTDPKLPDEEAVMALHGFIQDSLRYVSLSFGERAYVPAYPDSVLKHRMGDCKDLSVLFIDRMRKAGVEAWPALVHSRYRRNLFGGPPSYDATNHMVVYLPGREWWIDPTTEAGTPEFLPYHLSGAQALVLYPDSVVRKELPVSGDTDYVGSVAYACRVQDEDLACSRKQEHDRRSSSRMRSYLARNPKETWARLLHPPDWDGPFRITESATEVVGFDKKGGNLQVIRRFTAHRAAVRVGARSIIRFPETPAAYVFGYIDFADSASPVEIHGPVREDVLVEMEADKPIRWPALKSVKRGPFELSVSRPRTGAIRIRLLLPAGTYRGADRAALEAVLKDYKDFFASSMIAG